jgi:hypothetical protein
VARPCIETAFWAKVDKSNGPDACWLWTGRFGDDGYGKFMFREPGKRTTVRAHRMALTLSGDDPGDLLVLHRCDNPPCCNPAHLFPGTVQDNSDDRVNKGRQAYGEQAGCRYRSPLTDDDVRAVRAVRGDAAAVKVFAARFGVHPASIRRIARGARVGYVV